MRPRTHAIKLTAEDISLVIKQTAREEILRRKHFYEVVVPKAKEVQAKNPTYNWKTCCKHARILLRLF